MSPYLYLFKYIMVGDAGVGKSCLLHQFITKQYWAGLGSTINAEFCGKRIKIGNKPMKLQIWDTAGVEQFRCITRCYYRGAAAALLVYDVTRRESFEHLGSWLEEARQHAGNANMIIMVVGNKCDVGGCRRAVSREEGQEFAKKHGLMFVEASAKTAQNVDEVFVETAATLYKKIEDGVIDVSDECCLKSSGIQVGYAGVFGPTQSGCCCLT